MESIFNKIKKYNTWDGLKFNQGFKRATYLEKISDYLGNNLVKVLVGQRRTGKSYVLRQIMNTLITEHSVNPKNIFYLNKEYTAYDEITNAEKLEKLFTYYLEKNQPAGKTYIFLDEVQNIGNWENFVNSYSQDFTREYELFITGSNSKLLSGELATLLSGRYIEFEILPFSLFEYASYKKQSVDKNLFLNYLQTSGLPEMFNFNDEEIKRHYVGDLKNTIVLRDIVQRNQVKDLNLLEEIPQVLLV
jgi:predicted AAA+ superfamily ATPase